MKNLLRTLNTIRYLKPTQLAFFFWRRTFPARKIKINTGAALNPSFQLSEPIAVEGGLVNPESSTFSYLNESKTFGENIDWQCQGLSRLWGYNLHYFDYLRNEHVAVETKKRLVQSWIDTNPQNSEPGWEPFTTSLRIVNWIHFLSANPSEVTQGLRDSLFLQALWLEKNDERHILANHYFENLKALLFAGVFFDGKDAERWRHRAIKELSFQLDEQTLSDGGHYERSPQYHCLMQENYLDLYNLLLNNPALSGPGFVEQIKKVTEAGLAWLEDIVFPDLQIPLFNDSAFGIAPTLVELREYAHRLFDYPVNGVDAGKTHVHLINKPDSGLYGIRSENDMLVMDCGDIGPAYQPGHTHCDFLSFELMKESRRIIVDTGVSEYAPGLERQRLRSTAAHNTVSINGLEQSETWGEFRVARRAKKRGAAILKREDSVVISGTYEGFYETALGIGPAYRHSRQINVKLAKDGISDLAVVDRLSSLNTAQKVVQATSFVHFHPEVTLNQVQPGVIELSMNGMRLASLYLDGGELGRLESKIVDSCYCPEFGIKQKNKCLEISLSGKLPIEFGYRIQWM